MIVDDKFLNEIWIESIFDDFGATKLKREKNDTEDSEWTTSTID